jgi:diguanylate cyclase (GGDEF)-like protein/PAS domain S-box-containing protein
MVKAPVRVLLVEDNPADAELEVRELKRAGLQVEHHVVDAEQTFRGALQHFGPEIILSDFSMPHFDGMSALGISREQCPDTPFIFVSGTLGEEYAIRALKSGATDYVLKTNLVRLPSAVERALHEARERRERLKMEAELRQTRERLAGIMDSLPDMFWSVELPSERILYVSPTCVDIFGHAPEDFLRDPRLWLHLIHADDRPAAVKAWVAMVQSDIPFDVEYRVTRPDGGVRWVNDRGNLVRDAAGAPQRIDGVVRDITEQVEHRQRIARLSRIRYLAGAVNAAIVRIRDRQRLFEEFCRIAVEQGGFRAARLVESDADGRARLAVTDGDHEALLAGLIAEYNSNPSEAGGLLAAALRICEPVVANDVTNDTRSVLRRGYAASGINSVACLPLVVDGRAVGVVVLEASERQFFDEEEMRVLGELTSNISFALELMEKQARIRYLALYDALTGLPNRALFHERLTQALAAAQDGRARLAVAMIDLERFKAINDTFGEPIGDRVLQAVARRLEEHLAGVERVARLGSNLFAVLFPASRTSETATSRFEQALHRFFELPFEIEGREIRFAGKAGIALFPQDGADADTLFRNAEASLKKAKETGERYLFYTPDINARLAEQVEFEHRLRQAVERGELFPHYQPKVDLVTREIIGLEALMRWNGPDGGLVSPARFIPVLEQTGAIVEAGRQVLRAARAAYRDWSARGLKPPRIAVNVSALQLRRRKFVDDVRDALGAFGADGGGVDLEVTESLLMTDVDESIRKLREVRDLGVRIALDDFGTGYSSLAYLTRLPLDALKIDRSFVHGMTDNPDHTSIISAIISLAQALKLKVIAEGVETEQQAQLLRLLRCDQAQGYLFSPPLPAERIEALLSSVAR